MKKLPLFTAVLCALSMSAQGCHRLSVATDIITLPSALACYRWHIDNPIRFEKNLKVTIQALGWRSGGRHLPLQDDIASVVYWYQQGQHGPFPKLPSKDELEIN